MTTEHKPSEAFVSIDDKLLRDPGAAPAEAFDAVLDRLERDVPQSAFPLQTAVPLIFGSLAHAKGGLPEPALVDLVLAESGLDKRRRPDIQSTVALVLGHVRPFLVYRSSGVDFLYESFWIAALNRYTREGVQWPRRTAEAWNAAIATWCAGWRNLEGASLRYALRRLPGHQLAAGRTAEAATTMIDFAYHYTRLGQFGTADIEAITGDFAALLSAELPEKLRQRVQTWQLFRSQSAHFLRRPGVCPEIELLQKAYAHAEESPVGKSAEVWLRQQGAKHSWFRQRWRPKQALPNPCLLTLEGHTRGVNAVAVCADGRAALSVGEDKTLKVWDLATGECLRMLEGHTEQVKAVAVCADGRRAISGSDDKTLKVWNLETAKCLRTLHGHTGRIRAVAVCADGQTAISGSDDNTLKVWNLQTGECLRTVKGHTETITAVAVVADGLADRSADESVDGSVDTLKVISAFGTLNVLDLSTGECLLTLPGHESTTEDDRETDPGAPVGPVGAVRTFEDVFRLRAGPETSQLSPVEALAVYADGRGLVSAGSWGKTLKVWDLETGECLHTLRGHTDSVNAVAVCPDGRRAVSGSWDATLKVWDLETGECLRTFHGHTAGVNAVAVCPDGRRIVSGDREEGTLKVWDLDAGECPQTLHRYCASWIWAVAGCAQARLAMWHYGSTLGVWDLDTGKFLRTLRGHAHTVLTAAIYARGKRAISGSADHTLKVWDLSTGKCLRTLQAHRREVQTVAVYADGRRAVSGSRDRTLKVWDLETGVCIQTLLGHRDGINAVAVSADGRRAISASLDNTLKVWDLDTGTCLRTLQGQRLWFAAAAVLPDNRRAVSGDFQTLKVWELKTGACLQTLEGHNSMVSAVAVFEDGQRILSASDDGTLKVWDLETGACLATWAGDNGGYLCCTWVAGTTILAGAKGGLVVPLELMEPGPLVRHTCAVWSPERPLVAAALDSGAVTIYEWHPSSAHLEVLAHSQQTYGAVSSLRFSLDGTRIRVLAKNDVFAAADKAESEADKAESEADRAEATAGKAEVADEAAPGHRGHREVVLDATTLRPAAPPTCGWAEVSVVSLQGRSPVSPDGRWRAVIRDGQLEVLPIDGSQRAGKS